MTNTQKPHFQRNTNDRQSHPTVFAHTPISDPVQAEPGTIHSHPAGATRSLQHGRDILIQSGVPARRLADQEETHATTVPTHTRLAEQGSKELLPEGEAALPRQHGTYSHSVSRTDVLRPAAQAFLQTNDPAHTLGEQRKDYNFTPASQEPIERPRRGVRQDKARFASALRASPQPAPVTNLTRTRTANTTRTRSQTIPGASHKRERVTLWVDPLVKSALMQKAKREGLSISAAGAAYLHKSLQRDIDLEYSALLRPIIEQTIAKEMRSIATRLSWLLVRTAFDTGQTRSLVTNILGRQPGVTQGLLKTILEGSARSAKGNIMRRTPQITKLIEAVEQWMIEEEDQVGKPAK